MHELGFIVVSYYLRDSGTKSLGSDCSQLIAIGLQPKRDGWRYTIPHRETVAGEATARSATSKIMFLELE